MLFPLTLFTAASLVSAVPTRRAESTLTDVDILQYALTLENLENTFYSEALKKFDAEAFTKAGLPAFARGRFEQIAAHEKQHVALLSSAISATGGAPVKPCNYSFPYEDPESFVALSSLLEGVGVSAYLGAAKFISNKDYLTVAGSILTTEARHQAWVESAVNHAQPWSGPEDTPLRLDEVFTLAASFITSCPSNNTALPLKSFPPLTASPANAASGEKVTYAFKAGNATAPFYAAYYYGVAVETVKLDDQKSAAVPSGFLGTYYTVITTAADANITDANIVAGPLISVVDFPSTTHTST